MQSALSKLHHDLLMAVLLDGKDIFLSLPGTSRAKYDSFVKTVMRLSYEELYLDWKALNKALVTGPYVVLPHTEHVLFDASSIRWARQVFGIFTRLEGMCNSEESLLAWSKRCSTVRTNVPWSDAIILRLARRYIKRWLGSAPSLWDLQPKHGPGSVATGERETAKAHFSATYLQLDQQCARECRTSVLLSSSLLHLNLRHHSVEPHCLETQRHPITRVLAVPKDIMKPRIISCEPLTLQFLQQGLLRVMVKRLERATPCIRFSTQQPNRDAARNLACATLDMSDASDMISRTLVRQMFPDDWVSLLFSLRSHFAKMPDGRIVPLRTFAPMGSALCFPVEAVIFAALSCAHLELEGAGANVEDKVHVFGDDIIVPNQFAEGLIALLKRTGMKPNVAKCCFGPYVRFRESCGAEYFDTEDVSVFRPRTLVPSRIVKGFATDDLPMVSHANRALKHGYPRLAQAIANLYTLPVAIGYGDSYAHPDLKWPVIGQYRYVKRYQAWFQRVARVQPYNGVSMEDNYACLYMCLVAGWSDEYPIGSQTKLGYGWLPAMVPPKSVDGIVGRRRS